MKAYGNQLFNSPIFTAQKFLDIEADSWDRTSSQVTLHDIMASTPFQAVYSKWQHIFKTTQNFQKISFCPLYSSVFKYFGSS